MGNAYITYGFLHNRWFKGNKRSGSGQ
jgi:hypothetical protein